MSESIESACEPYLPTTKVASMVGLPHRTLLKLINDGRVPALNVAPKGALKKHYMLLVSDVRNALEGEKHERRA